MNIIETILAAHSHREKVAPGDIVDIDIDVRLARDFGGANVIKNLNDNMLAVKDPSKTFFTFDCNPTGSDQSYATNQHKCRLYAREHNIGVFDIDAGIGTHIAIDQGLAVPGATLVSTDSHANILGAIGAFGQGMGDRDIAAAWANGAVWFKVPPSVKIILNGQKPPAVTAKDIILNLLQQFGANSLLGYSLELYGHEIDKLSLDQRVTISSMATELGAIALLIPPSEEVLEYCSLKAGKKITPVFADKDAEYEKIYEININDFVPVIALPGQPHGVVPVKEVRGIKIDSAFVGSCTNGRMEDMRVAARMLKNKKPAPGVVLKIVPATDEIWKQCLKEGLIETFKAAGVLFGNAGCAGCAAGQVGQNGPGEITISTGNRNFPGKQGKGEVYLASPEIAIASAIAGHITDPENLPSDPTTFTTKKEIQSEKVKMGDMAKTEPKTIVSGRVWIIPEDNIDTDMIYHNQHLAITEMADMGKFTFGNLKGWEDFAKKAQPGDIVIAGKNFGAGSSRQQAVDCFKSLGIQAIVAESFGAIYERNAINAGFPVLTYSELNTLELKEKDTIELDFSTGRFENLRNKTKTFIGKFADVQMEIYKKGDLLNA